MRAWTGEPEPTPVAAREPSPPPPPTPQQLKTRIAREAVVAVLERSGREMARAELVEVAFTDPRVRAAGVSRATVAAQLGAALLEEPPRVIRVCRGIYAAAGPPEAALGEPRHLLPVSRTSAAG